VPEKKSAVAGSVAPAVSGKLAGVVCLVRDTAREKLAAPLARMPTVKLLEAAWKALAPVPSQVEEAALNLESASPRVSVADEARKEIPTIMRIGPIVKRKQAQQKILLPNSRSSLMACMLTGVLAPWRRWKLHALGRRWKLHALRAERERKLHALRADAGGCTYCGQTLGAANDGATKRAKMMGSLALALPISLWLPLSLCESVD